MFFITLIYLLSCFFFLASSFEKGPDKPGLGVSPVEDQVGV